MIMKENSQRWQTPDGAKLAEEVLRYLAEGKPLKGLGLPEHKGRVDLRRLSAPNVTMTELTNV